MEPRHRPIREHFRMVLFALALIVLVLFLLSLLFGRILGFRYSLTVFFWFAVLAAGVMALIGLADVVRVLICRGVRFK